MNNFQNQTPPPVLRNHHQHLQSANYHQHQQQQQHHHHTTSSSSSSASVTTTLQHPTPPLSNTQFMTPHHHQHSHHHHHHHQQQHLSMAANQSLLPVPTPPLPPLPPPSQKQQQQQQQQQHQPQPLISNSLAIRQEIQRFESVHPSIYAIYDLIDLLPITDAQIAQQIRDHVVCIEGTTFVEKGWVLNSQAKKFVKNVIKQMPCGWPELGIPAVAPYINPDLELHLQKNPINSSLQFIRFKFEGLDNMIIKDLKVSYTFNKLVKFHFQFKKLKATAAVLNLHTLADALQQMGVAVEYEGSGPLEVTLENVSLKGSYKYKMPVLTGSVKIYKFNAILKLDSVAFNMGNILGNGVYNNLVNQQIEKLIPEIINGNAKLVSEELERQIVPRVNAFFNGKKLWDVLAMIGQPGHKCKPTPAPWLLQN